MLGPRSSILEVGCLVVLWFTLPYLTTITAGRIELRVQEELPSEVRLGREVMAFTLAWERRGSQSIFFSCGSSKGP